MMKNKKIQEKFQSTNVQFLDSETAVGLTEQKLYILFMYTKMNTKMLKNFPYHSCPFFFTMHMIGYLPYYGEQG